MPNRDPKEQIGKSLGRIVSGVGVLTAQDRNQPTAMLASWFQQASFDPPMISVAIKKGRPIAEVIKASERFVLNILHTGQKKILAHFGKGSAPDQDPFKGIAIHKTKDGIPALKEALCFLECELRQVYASGDHSIFLGEVVNGASEEEGAPMVHMRRSGFNY